MDPFYLDRIYKQLIASSVQQAIQLWRPYRIKFFYKVFVRNVDDATSILIRKNVIKLSSVT